MSISKINMQTEKLRDSLNELLVELEEGTQYTNEELVSKLYGFVGKTYDILESNEKLYSTLRDLI